MNVIISAITPIRNRIVRSEKTTRIDNRMILSTLRSSIYPPMIPRVDVPTWWMNHAHKATPATHTHKFLLTGRKEMLFLLFFSAFFIIQELFFCRTGAGEGSVVS